MSEIIEMSTNLYVTWWIIHLQKLVQGTLKFGFIRKRKSMLFSSNKNFLPLLTHTSFKLAISKIIRDCAERGEQQIVVVVKMRLSSILKLKQACLIVSLQKLRLSNKFNAFAR